MFKLSRNAAIAQPVERILGKDEVASSNLASSSKIKRPSVRMVFLFWPIDRFEDQLQQSGGLLRSTSSKHGLPRYFNMSGQQIPSDAQCRFVLHWFQIIAFEEHADGNVVFIIVRLGAFCRCDLQSYNTLWKKASPMYLQTVALLMLQTNATSDTVLHCLSICTKL